MVRRFVPRWNAWPPSSLLFLRAWSWSSSDACSREDGTLTYLFTHANQELLQIFAWSNVLLAFDYDGTLAPLVAAPRQAMMRMSTRRLLRRASKLYPCLVISGRARSDALGR